MATWQDIASFVEAFHAPEGGTRNNELYLALANRALAQIGTRVGHFETYWNNDPNDSTHGTLILSGAEVIFPTDLVDAVSVYWNGIKLEEWSSSGEFDAYQPDWRSAQGTPTAFLRNARGITLNAVPDGATDGMLVVYGLGTIPKFGVGSDAAPLSYLTDDDQLLIADFIIANLPVDLRGKTAEEVAAINHTRAKAEQRWQEGLETCVANLLRRKLSPVTGG